MLIFVRWFDKYGSRRRRIRSRPSEDLGFPSTSAWPEDQLDHTGSTGPKQNINRCSSSDAANFHCREELNIWQATDLLNHIHRRR